MNTPLRLLYGILITVAIGAALGRIFSAQLVLEPSQHSDQKTPGYRLWPKPRPTPMPTFSSNDRSRWATIRALVDEGTYVVGHRNRAVALASAVALLGSTNPLDAATIAQAGYDLRTKKEINDTGIIFTDGYGGVDNVLHPATWEFYSSKPPLFSTLVAALYWVLKTLFGWTLATHPFAVVRTILLLVNLLPFLIYLNQIARLAERFGRTEWGRMFVLACAAFGTLVTPFLTTLNNHTVATYCVLFTMVSLVEIWRRAPRRRGGLADEPVPSPWQHHVAAGLFASFAACIELPALSLAVAVFVLLLYWAPRRALTLFLAAAAVPAIGFFATNYAAVGQLRPAYSEFDGPTEGYAWYQYEGSHWRKPPPGYTKPGIDWAGYHESRGAYIFHLLVGHHGLFSLTPIWLLTLGPMLGGLWHLRRNWQKTRRAAKGDPPLVLGHLFDVGESPGLPWFVAPLTLALTVVVVGFYVLKSDNYGGFTVGLRWLMWLSPLWLLCLLPSADRLAGSRWGRGLAYACLGISVLSAHYSSWNPWRHPWLYDLLIALGWPGY